MTAMDSWAHALARLQAWAEQHGHARVPQAHVESDGFRLGKWVHNARSAYRARSSSHSRTPLSDARVNALERIPGWTWNTRATSTTPTVQPPLPTAVFDMKAAEFAVMRVLHRWCTTRAANGAPLEFTEQMLADDPVFQEALDREIIRASLAALTATEQVRATREGTAMAWRDVLIPEELDASWAFQLRPDRPSGQPIPVKVLSTYEDIASRAWDAPIPTAAP